VKVAVTLSVEEWTVVRAALKHAAIVAKQEDGNEFMQDVSALAMIVEADIAIQVGRARSVAKETVQDAFRTDDFSKMEKAMAPDLTTGTIIYRPLDSQLRPRTVVTEVARNGRNFVAKAVYGQLLDGDWTVESVSKGGAVIFIDRDIPPSSNWTSLIITRVADNKKSAHARVEFGNWEELESRYAQSKKAFDAKRDALKDKFGRSD